MREGRGKLNANSFRVNSNDLEGGRRNNSFRNFMEIDGKGNKRRAITSSGRSPAVGGMGGGGFAYSIMGPTSYSVSDIFVRGWPVRGNLDSAVKLADEYKCQGRLEADLMPLEPGRPETSGRAINLASCRLPPRFVSRGDCGDVVVEGERRWISRCLVSIVG